LAAAEATIKLLNASLIRNSAEVGAHLMQRLQNWPKQHPIVGEVRGRGLMIGIEIVSDQAARTPDAARRDRIVDEAFKLGLLVLGCGSNSLRLMPPLICNREQADMAMDILEKAMAASS
jgi:4-aminobutyrate aminotransferase